MRHLRAYVVAAVIAGVAGACAPSTRITQSWKDPASTNLKFDKIVAVCMCKDAALRRSVEDEMVKRIRNSVASHTILREDEGRDPERARQVFQEKGFDGAVVARLVGVDETSRVSPGAYRYQRATERCGVVAAIGATAGARSTRRAWCRKRS